ncbi:MAG: hypothetical protein EB833_05115 [Thaumarchaeota archaeon S13]|nr:MAG: hypothetical protein EB833_05115 [Thaumarchaeota archaeon S13]
MRDAAPLAPRHLQQVTGRRIVNSRTVLLPHTLQSNSCVRTALLQLLRDPALRHLISAIFAL